jgi:hypothetical protein
MNNQIIEFKLHLKSTSKQKLTSIQTIVEFYFWLRKLDKRYEPFDRHVKAAKKINDWSDNDLTRALELVGYIGSYMSERDLNYTLDTVHRMIPEFETYLEKQKKWQADDDEYWQNSKRLREEYGYHKQSNSEEQKEDETDF